MKLSQGPGHHGVAYRIYPHAGYYDKGGVLEEADRHVAPVEPVQHGKSNGDLPQRHGFLSLTPETLQMSALKQADSGNGWILRLYNPTAKSVTGALSLPTIVANVNEVTLEETPLRKLPLDNHRLTVEMSPKKIVTLLLGISHPGCDTPAQVGR